MKSLSPNTLLQNRYLVVSLIGKGGMGEVYLAIDQRLGNHVALKRTFFTDDEVLAIAFEREARTLANLRHKALTKVSDHFVENDEQFLVMEYISGEDLTKRLEVAKKPFPMNWVLFWADELLDALAYLHAQEPQIIHRDIKPQNLKLTADNHVILLDFGLAKNSNTPVQSSTSGSSIVGYTPHYAPMEQIRGMGTTPKSDIYSLSATLYQLMTNIVPPDALSRADELLNGKADCLQPLNALNSEIPASISSVILKGMALRPDERYSDARSMQLALREAYANQKDSAAQTDAIPQSQMKTEQFAVPVVAEDIADTQVDFGATMQMGSTDLIGEKTEIMPSSIGEKTEIMPFSSFEKTDDSPSITEEKTEIIPTFPMVEQLSEDNNATVPFINFNDQKSDAETAQTFDSGSQEVPVKHRYESFEFEEPKPVEESFEPAPVIASAPVAKKASSGKMFAILGIVGLFGVLAIGGGGAAWYVMNNKTAATPTPKATPKVESSTPNPTPESTVEIKAGTNTEVNSNSVANSNVNANTEPKNVGVKSTPTPVSGGDKPKPTPPPVIKADTPVPATPKPSTPVTKTPAPLSPPKNTPPPKKQPTVKPEILQ